MRYKKGKRGKGKKFGKEYIVPYIPNYDSPNTEEIDDNLVTPEADESNVASEQDHEDFQVDNAVAGEEIVELDLDDGDAGEETVESDLDNVDVSEEIVESDLDGGDVSEETVESDLDSGDVREEIVESDVENCVANRADKRKEKKKEKKKEKEKKKGKRADDTLIFDGPICVEEAEGPVDSEGVVIYIRGQNEVQEDDSQPIASEPDIPDEGLLKKGLKYRRARKVRKNKNYTLRIFVGILCIAGVYLLLTSKLFNIEEIDVVNNEYYTPEQVIEMAGVETNTNMFKTRMTPIEKALEKDSYIKNAQIKRKPFNKIEIILEEREEKYCILSEEKYIIADYEGIVLSIVEELPPLTVIDSLGVKEAEIGHEIKTESNLIFSEIISFLIAVEDNDLYFKQIEASDVMAKAYMTDIFLCKGAIKNMEKDMPQIKKVIHDLSEKQIGRGTIIVTGNGSCTFNPQI